MGILAIKDDGRREELLDGIVCMSPRPVVNHSIVVSNIHYAFKTYLKGKQCVPFADGIDVTLTDNDRVIPDAMIVCNPDIIHKDGIYGTPDLIVEVLSPSTAKNDRGYKKDLYERCGVKAYWIVDIENKSVEVYLNDNAHLILNEIYSILPEYQLIKLTDDERTNLKKEIPVSLYTDFAITLTDVFADMR